MIDAWFALVMLAIESNEVMALRLSKIAAGGSDAFAESALMVQEKLAASIDAQAALLWGGGTFASTVAGYRQRVAANAKRLGAPVTAQ